MKLVELGSFGDQGLSFVERGQPSPCLGEVVVKMKAASINYRDFMIAKGFIIRIYHFLLFHYQMEQVRLQQLVMTLLILRLEIKLHLFSGWIGMLNNKRECAPLEVMQQES